jgi:hypothetical protein
MPATEPRPVNLLTVGCTSDKYAHQIQTLRSLEDKVRRDRIKASLPAITVSGSFHPSRKEEHLVKHSGLICIDIDLKGNEHIANFAALKEQLFHIENVAYAGLSASGKGFFLIIPIAYPKRHIRNILLPSTGIFLAWGWPLIRLRKMWPLCGGIHGTRERCSGIKPNHIENGRSKRLLKRRG